MLPLSLREQLELVLPSPIHQTELISQTAGVELHEVQCLEGVFMVKTTMDLKSDALICEMDGLQALQKAGAPIPKILSWTDQWLVLEKIITENPTRLFWIRLGEVLARLHQFSAPGFGYPMANWIGGARQIQDAPRSDLSWGEFFWTYRLSEQWDRLSSRQNFPFSNSERDRLERVCQDRLNDFKSQPTLLHGDLWAGNVLCGPEQSPYLIDPAVSYGDGEADVAMTECFNRFPDEFYQAYRSQRPLDPGYDYRKPVYNLYHLFNHWNLFGDAYASVCKKTLQSLIS